MTWALGEREEAVGLQWVARLGTDSGGPMTGWHESRRITVILLEKVGLQWVAPGQWRNRKKS